MLYIIKNTANNVVLTLTEKQTIATPDWLFEFTNETTGEVKLFTAPDISPATLRYNQFTITETTTEDLYAGNVELDPTGYWLYNIYEMNPTSPVDLDPVNAVTLVEQGKVLVKGADTPPDTFVVDDPINNVVFDN